MIIRLVKSAAFVAIWCLTLYISVEILTSIIIHDRSPFMLLLLTPFVWLQADFMASLYDLWDTPYEHSTD